MEGWKIVSEDLTREKQDGDLLLLTTFQLVVIERPVLIDAVLDAVRLDAVGTAGFVLENHSEGVFFFRPQHRA